MLKGIPASQGIGIGNAIIINETKLDFSTIQFTNVESEKARLNIAVEKYTSSIRSIENEILQGHLAMLSDPFMLSQMEELIANGCIPEKAVETVCNSFVDMFSAVDDELTRQRVSDIKDIRDSLLKILLGAKSVDISAVPSGSVLIAKDFTPSMTSQINKENVSAIITEIGGITSHSAILARSMGIPAVLSVPNATEIIAKGDMIIVDGFKGGIITQPSQSQIEEYSQKQEQYLKEKESLLDYFGKATVTKNGKTIKLYGNIGKAEDAQNVLQNSGEGIGLFRTEFLFMDREKAPSEQEQFEAYSTVAKAMNGKEVIIRTLDIGGDKAIDYLDIQKEDNPFLGHRAIRFCLDNTEIFKTQIRAILRASEFGDIKIMLPLVTTLDEVQKAKAIINECEIECKAKKKVPLGIMIETPASAIISDVLAKEVDFFSIGTNDLTGYTMAVDRGNPKVCNLYDIMQPAVLRLIEMTIKNAKKAGIMVGMCGEGAADKRIIPHLIEWGIDELSVTPSAILQTRKTINNYE